MNPDLEYAKSRAVSLISDPMRKFQQLEAERGVALLANELHMEEAEAQYEQKQQAQVSQINEAGAGIKQVLSEAAAQFRDETLQEQFNATLQDESNKARFGTSPPKGIPGAIAAAREQYSAALLAKDTAAKFPVDPFNQDVIDLMAQARRRDAVEAYKTNLGMTEEEADDRVSQLYGPLEVGLGLVDPKTPPPSEPNFFGKALDAIGQSLVGAIDVATVVTDPPIDAALHYSTVWLMKDEDFQKHYPEQAGKIARAYALAQKVELTGTETEELARLKKDIAKLKAWTTKQWVRHSTALPEAVKAGLSEAWRKLSRSHDRDPEKTIKPFVRLLTDNEKYQKIAEPVVEVLGVVPALTAEVLAAKIAKNFPKFYNPTTREAIVTLAKDLFIGGQSDAYRTPAITDAMNRAIQTAARSESAVTGRPVAEAEQWIAQMFEDGDFSQPSSRSAAENIIKTFRANPEITEQEKTIADILEAKIKGGEAEQAATAGKTVPIFKRNKEIDSGEETAGQIVQFFKINDKYERIVPPEQVVDEVVTDDFLAKVVADLGAKVDNTLAFQAVNRAVDAGDGTKAIEILYRDDITLESMFDSAYKNSHSNGLELLGFDESLLRQLVTTDNEAKLFILLHEKAHLDAKDVLRKFATPAPNAGPVQKAVVLGDAPARRNESEQLAMLYALRQFSTLTGKPFHNVIHQHYTPGTFVEFTEQGDVVFRAIPLSSPETMNRAVEAIAGVFRQISDLGDVMSQVKALPRLFSGILQPKDLPPPLVLEDIPASNGMGSYKGVPSAVYNQELGQLFGVKRVEGMSEGDYGAAIYQAFKRRFGATASEVAKGTKRFPDADPAYVGWKPVAVADELMQMAGNQPTPEQIAKVVELIEGWRNIKTLLRVTKGTDMEQNANNLALAWRSQVVDFGDSYTRVMAGIESINRNAPYTRNMWVDEVPPAAAPVTPGTPMRPRISAGSWKGTISSMTDKELDRGKGIVHPDNRRLWHEYSSGYGVTPDPNMSVNSQAMAHAGEGGTNDAMTTAVSMEKVANDEGIIVKSKTAKLREADLIAHRADTDFSGPVTPATHSFDGTPEQLRVMQLEEFAGVSSMPENISQNGRINVFHVGDEQLNGALKAIHDGPKGPQLFRQLRNNLNSQISEMATRIAGMPETSDFGDELVLFHRALAVAKGMKEIADTGKTSLTTSAWLKEMDFHAGAVGQTVEEAITSGIQAVLKVYGFAFRVQEKGQILRDKRMANLFLSARDKDGFIEEYARIMSGPEAVKGRQELNELAKQLRVKIGGPCS